MARALAARSGTTRFRQRGAHRTRRASGALRTDRGAPGPGRRTAARAGPPRPRAPSPGRQPQGARCRRPRPARPPPGWPPARPRPRRPGPPPPAAAPARMSVCCWLMQRLQPPHRAAPLATVALRQAGGVAGPAQQALAPQPAGPDPLPASRHAGHTPHLHAPLHPRSLACSSEGWSALSGARPS